MIKFWRRLILCLTLIVAYMFPYLSLFERVRAIGLKRQSCQIEGSLVLWAVVMPLFDGDGRKEWTMVVYIIQKAVTNPER